MGDIWDGTVLLGVKAVSAKRFERSQRANLVGMGALLPNFIEGDRAAGLDLDGTETLDCAGLDKGGTELTINAKKADASAQTFQTCVRVNTPVEWDDNRAQPQRRAREQAN